MILKEVSMNTLLKNWTGDHRHFPPYYKTRGKWEEHLILFENVFFNDDKWKQKTVLRKTKIGRNEPCPCGKTKLDGGYVKYKKCK